VIMLYCAVGIALYYLQDRILFHAEKFNTNYTYRFQVPFRELNIPFSKTDTLNLIQFLPESNTKPKGVVLFFHGTNGSIKNYAERAAIFTKQNYEVWMPDYPGFGKSTGDFSENKINNQAFEINKLALNRFPKDQIIVYGQSIGSSVATTLASSGNSSALILENPFVDVADLLHHYTFIYPWSKMANSVFSVKGAFDGIDKSLRVTILVGPTSEWHSAASANKLKPLLDSNDSFVQMVQKTATDVINEQEYKDVVEKLLKGH